MITISYLVTGFSLMFLLLAAIAFMRAKDLFVMVHVVIIANFYIIPMLLVGIELEKFSVPSFAKILVLIMLNLLIAILLCHAAIRNAVLNKIRPDI